MTTTPSLPINHGGMCLLLPCPYLKAFFRGEQRDYTIGSPRCPEDEIAAPCSVQDITPGFEDAIKSCSSKINIDNSTRETIRKQLS